MALVGLVGLIKELTVGSRAEAKVLHKVKHDHLRRFLPQMDDLLSDLLF